MPDISSVDAIKLGVKTVAEAVKKKIAPTRVDQAVEKIEEHVYGLPLIDAKGKFIFYGTRSDDEKRTTPWEIKGGSAEYGYTTLTFRDFTPAKDKQIKNFKSVLGGGLELKPYETTEGDLEACAKELEALGYDLKGVPPSRIVLSVTPGREKFKTVSSQEWWFKDEKGVMSAVVLAYEPENKATDRYALPDANPRKIFVADAVINPKVGKFEGIKPDRVYSRKPPNQPVVQR